MLLLLSVVVLCLGIMFWFVGWRVHLSQVEDHSHTYAWGNFSDFKRMFDSADLVQSEKWPESWFERSRSLEEKNEIHADIIKFDSVGMKLDPISYLMFKHWEHGLKKEKRKSKKEKTKPDIIPWRNKEKEGK